VERGCSAFERNCTSCSHQQTILRELAESSFETGDESSATAFAGAKVSVGLRKVGGFTFF
jgi:hypothetical protein